MKKKYKPIFIDGNSDRTAIFSSKEVEILADNYPYQVNVSSTKNNLICNRIVTYEGIAPGTIGLSSNAFQKLQLNRKLPKTVNVQITPRDVPESYSFIKKRMKRNSDFAYNQEQMDNIVHDIISGQLSSLEKTAFVLTQQFRKFSLDEIEYFTRSMAFSGETIDFDEVTYDKHSLGGVPGNKVTLLIVPIVAAADLLIPKTSSRAITSPSGTADTMEALGCEVSFNASEIVEISKKTRGVIVWGGALNLAPADSILIKDVQFPLGIDPSSMFMASIMAKKKALGADFLVLDIPTGKGTKVSSLAEARQFARIFAELGQRLDIQVESGITFASLPVGHHVGPALEAQEALFALINPKKASTSLIEKSTVLAGMILEQAGKAIKGQGQNMAKDILFSGKAYIKMKEIIEAQNGDPTIKPEDIPIGQYYTDFIAPVSGWPADIDNSIVNQIAKTAGAPTDKGAGIKFLVKKESVKAGEVIFRVFTNSSDQLAKVESLIQKINPIAIEGMLLERI